MGLCGSVLVGLRLLIEHIPHHLIGVEGLGGVADHGDGQLRMKAQEVRDGLQLMEGKATVRQPFSSASVRQLR